MSMAEHIPLMVGVTGHRDLVPAEEPAIRRAVAEFLSQLKADFPDLPIVVMTGLAQGADMLVAEQAERSGCEVVHVLPMPRALYEADFSAEELVGFNDMCQRHETIELPLLEESDAESPKRDLQYVRLGAFLAAHSHIMLALWDGKYNQASGGTSQVIEFHQRDISTLAEDQIRSRLDIADDESDLVYHIVCSRVSEGGPASGLTAGTGSWYTRDDRSPRVSELPQRYVSVFRSIAAFNADQNRLPAGTETYRLEPEKVGGNSIRSCATIQSVFGVSDALASMFQRRVVWALRATLIATVLAGLSFIIYADFADQENMIWGYFVWVLVALGAYLFAQRGDWQRRYLDYRVLAEGLRVQYYWAMAGVEMRNPSRYSHDSFFQGRDLELGWIRNVMRFTGLHADAKTPPNEERLNAAIEGWVGDTASGQLGYYHARADDMLTKHNRTNRVISVAFALGLAAAAVLAFGGDAVQGLANNGLVALMGLLPIIAAARQNYAHRQAERELAAQYAHMLEVFGSAHRLLNASDDPLVKQEILRDLGEAALNENAQWVLRQRERPLPGRDPVG